MAYRAKKLPARSPEEMRELFPHVRQSRLADFDSCALMTRFGLEGYEYTNAAQARGILFHRYAGEILNTLRETGEVQLPHNEAMAILYEVCAQRDVPDVDVVTLPAHERRLLRICAVQFAKNRFQMDRLVDVERRLYATVSVMDPETQIMKERTLTGQPDALLADPPDGAIVLDWKTTRKAPPIYDGKDTDTPEGVSYMGYFQQRFYALLVFHNYPSVKRVTLREFYPLEGAARTATVERKQLEYIELEMATQVELFDRAMAGGHDSPIWEPSPGKHCTYCPRPGQCPIEAEARGDGAITSGAMAKRYAAELVVAERVKNTRRDALKPWVEVHGPVPVKSGKGRYVVGWQDNKTGHGRTFKVHVPSTSTRGPKDKSLEAALKEAADRKREAVK